MKKNVLKGLPEGAIEAVAARFKALGEVSRLKIIQALHTREMSVTEIVEETELSQPNVSRHLSVLASTKLIGKRKDGSSALYRIIDQNLNEICSIVCKSVKSN